jgi:hypothetical protein
MALAMLEHTAAIYKKECIHIFVYIRGAFFGVTKEQFNSINMHGINAVKIEEHITD